MNTRKGDGSTQAISTRHNQCCFSQPMEQEERSDWAGFIILSLPKAACRSSPPVPEPSPSGTFDGRYGAQLQGGQERRSV